MLPRLDAGPPITCLSSPQYDDPLSVVATPQFLPFLLIPDPGPRVARTRKRTGTTWRSTISNRKQPHAVHACCAPR